MREIGTTKLKLDFMRSTNQQIVDYKNKLLPMRYTMHPSLKRFQHFPLSSSHN